VGGIKDEGVHAHGNQGRGAVQYVARHAQGGGAQQPAGRVLGGVGVLQDLFNVLDGDESLELVILVHYGELLYLVLLEDGLGFVEGGADKACDKVLVGHDLIDLAGHVLLKFHIAVGDDADKPAGFIHDGHAGDAKLCHKCVGVGKRVAGRQGEGVCNNSVSERFTISTCSAWRLWTYSCG
jgi:hypothetical protein